MSRRYFATACLALLGSLALRHAGSGPGLVWAAAGFEDLPEPQTTSAGAGDNGSGQTSHTLDYGDLQSYLTTASKMTQGPLTTITLDGLTITTRPPAFFFEQQHHYYRAMRRARRQRRHHLRELAYLDNWSTGASPSSTSSQNIFTMKTVYRRCPVTLTTVPEQDTTAIFTQCIPSITLITISTGSASHSTPVSTSIPTITIAPANTSAACSSRTFTRSPKCSFVIVASDTTKTTQLEPTTSAQSETGASADTTSGSSSTAKPSGATATVTFSRSVGCNTNRELYIRTTHFTIMPVTISRSDATYTTSAQIPASISHEYITVVTKIVRTRTQTTTPHPVVTTQTEKVIATPVTTRTSTCYRAAYELYYTNVEKLTLVPESTGCSCTRLVFSTLSKTTGSSNTDTVMPPATTADSNATPPPGDLNN